MKMIDNLIRVPVEDSKYIYLNALNGAIDIVDEDVDCIVRKWIENGIRIDSQKDYGIKDLLENRKYILQQEEELSLKQDLYSRLRDDLGKRQSEVEFMSFVLTYDCNFRCPYCYQQKVLEKGEVWVKRVISKDMIDVAFDRYDDTVKTVHLFGGEPLMLENYDIVKYILDKKENVNIHITTNGYNLSEYMPLLKQHNIGIIEITLDGLEKKHNSRRFLASGEGTFSKILSGIKSALDNDIKVLIRMNVDDTNLNEGKLLGEELNSIFKNKNLSFFRNPIFGDKNVCKHEVLAKMITDADALSDGMEETIDSLHPILKAIKGTGKWTPKYVFCKAHKGNRFFDPHGNMYSCFLAVGNEEKRIGKYYPNETIENDWMKRTVENMPKCSNCNKALFCGGGCTNAAIDLTGDFMQGYCTPTNELLYKLIPLVFKKYCR